MKPAKMNETHKKWALTATLVAVLGFNLSAPLKSQFGSLDLASNESKAVQIAGKDGKVHEVIYVRQGDKTIAMVPVALEGRTCVSNGACLNPKVLNVSFDKDLIELEAALRQEIEKKVVVETPASDEDEIPEAVSKEDRDEEKKRMAEEALARVVRACARKDEGYDSAKCLIDNYLKTLKNYARSGKADRKIDASMALDFFKEEIQEQLMAMVNEDESRENYDRLGNLLRKLQAGLPKGYNVVRDEAKDVAVEALQSYAQIVRKQKSDAALARSQADTYTQQANLYRDSNPTASLQYQNLAMQLQAQAMRLDQLAMVEQNNLQYTISPALYGNTQLGLEDAYRLKYIDQSYGQTLLNNLSTESLSVLTGIALPGVTNGGTTLSTNGLLVRPTDAIYGGTIGGVSRGTSRFSNTGLLLAP